MKLSAPPPPPPEPNEPGLPAPEQPAGVVAPETPEASPPVPPIESKQATWPVWFSGADFVLAVFAVVLAFLAASFVAKNSDIFLHLATGQRLLAGTYTPGTDPFSFSAADRPWVNHSLLFDVGAYLLYSGNGATLSVLKAIAIAVAFALVIGIRRPGFSLWPWAIVAAIGVVAAAPYLHLRPTAGSILLLAVTLFLLFRVPHQPGSWRFPIAIGVTFWVWSNTDEWFFLGPMALALVLIGEVIQRAMRKPEPATDGQTVPSPEEDPVGLPPAVSTLARALAIGVLVCMLNPNHVRVWQLPFELVGDRQMTEDIRFKQLLVTPLERDYTDKAHLGYNQNGLAFALLFVGGGTALGLGAGRVRFAHIALWVGFALIVLGTVQAIPYLAIVAVPIIAGQLNSLSSRVSLKTWGDPKTRFLLLGSAAGRVLSVIGILIACVFAWPGWIHPPTGNPAFVRRVAWGVEADPGMARGAEQLQAWRKSGQLPADAHGFQTTLEFANYCAWFAPDEKVYANGRFNHHRPELPTYLTVRKGLQLVASSERPNPKDLDAALQKSGVEYVVLQSAPGDGSPYIAIQTGIGDAFQVRGAASIASIGQWLDPEHWSPWYMDGRTSISGWRSKPGAEKPTFAALKFSAVTLAFGDKVERLPAVATQPVRPYGGWEEGFLRSPNLPPPGADDSMIWNAYRNIGEQLRQQQEFAIRLTAALTDRLVGGVGLVSRVIPLPPPDMGLRASAFLSLRAARRAIATDPNHPDGYFALYRALDARELPFSDPDRAIAQVTALRQCLERMPPPEEFRPGVYAATPSDVAARLAWMYLAPRADYGNVHTGIPVNSPAFAILSARFGATGYLVGERTRVVRKSAAALQGQQVQPIGGPYLMPLDLAREAILKAQEYVVVDAVSSEAAASSLAKLKEVQKLFETELAQANNAYESRRAAQKPRLPDQIQMAIQANLAGEALRLFNTKDVDLGKEFGPALLDFLLCRISLELAIGRLEDAVADLDQLATDPGIQKALNDAKLGDVFRLLMYQRYILEGNYAEAGSILESLDGKNVGLDPMKPLRDKFDPKFFVVTGEKLTLWAEFAPLAGLLAPTPFDLLARVRGPGAALGGEENSLGFLPLRNELANRRSQDAEFFYQRGLLSLYEGDIPAARKRFLQTRQPAVKDWGLPEYRNGSAELYLRLIAEAEKAAPAK
ncbi:MAG: hypothetical protein C0467_14800 [Planctomycetaceae bacterium]|nr:hypothetical protein [Planctomycetaceae bacterium]